MNHVGPFLFIAARASVAALALAPLALLELRRRGSEKEHPVFDRPGLVKLGVMGGVFFFLGAAFQQAGLQTATVTNAGFLTGLYVVITPLIMWITARRAPGSVVWTAVVMAFTGTWALGGGTVTGFSYGDILIAICAIFWSIHIVVTADRPFPRAHDLYLRPVRHRCRDCRDRRPPVRADLGGCARQSLRRNSYVGVLSSALTFTLLAIAMKHTPASEAAVLVSMETLFAALAGAVLLGGGCR